jgi:hypothetical protein
MPHLRRALLPPGVPGTFSQNLHIPTFLSGFQFPLCFQFQLLPLFPYSDWSLDVEMSCMQFLCTSFENDALYQVLTCMFVECIVWVTCIAVLAAVYGLLGFFRFLCVAFCFTGKSA